MLLGIAANHVGTCALPHCFSLVASGENLGAFAAVLTAFTFPAIIFLARKDGDEDGLGETQILFLAAFVSLATTTYLFSGVAAEEREGYRAAFEAFVASLVLSVSLQLLILGITQLMRHHAFDSTTRFAAYANNLFVGPLIFAFMTATAVNGVELHASSSQAYQSVTFFVCLGFAAVLAVWMAASYLIYRVCRPTTVCPSASTWAAGIIGITALASGFTLVWAEVKPDHAMPASVYLGFMALLLVATMGYSLQLTAIGAMTRRMQTANSVEA